MNPNFIAFQCSVQETRLSFDISLFKIYATQRKSINCTVGATEYIHTRIIEQIKKEKEKM